MDAFSWYRRRRQTPSGRFSSASDETHIPFAAAPPVGFIVYCRLDSDAEPPAKKEMQDIALRWLESHSCDPLRPLLREFLAQGLLTPRIELRDDVPEPPDDTLRAYNPGELEERRFRSATHAIFVGTPDLMLPPRVGLWAALTMARALASAFPGAVIVDPEFPRLLPMSANREMIPADGRIRIVEHILVPYSHDPRTGLLWMTTKGMGRFGLPDLELRDVPPNLAEPLLPVVNGVAQWAVDRAMHKVLEILEAGGTPSEDATTLTVRAEKVLRLKEIRRAYAPEILTEDLESDDTDENAGEARIRVEMGESRRGERTLLRVTAPLNVCDGNGIWLNALLKDLFGGDAELAEIATGDADMEIAHREALNELPLIRSRFQAGFRSGEALHIKHGFPTPDSSREFMWIAVTRWENGCIRGFLANDPQYRHDLRAGQSIEIAEEDAFDWLIVHPDGREEGAFTNRLLQEE